MSSILRGWSLHHSVWHEEQRWHLQETFTEGQWQYFATLKSLCRCADMPNSFWSRFGQSEGVALGFSRDRRRKELLLRWKTVVLARVIERNNTEWEVKQSASQVASNSLRGLTFTQSHSWFSGDVGWQCIYIVFTWLHFLYLSKRRLALNDASQNGAITELLSALLLLFWLSCMRIVDCQFIEYSWTIYSVVLSHQGPYEINWSQIKSKFILVDEQQQWACGKSRGRPTTALSWLACRLYMKGKYYNNKYCNITITPHRSNICEDCW